MVQYRQVRRCHFPRLGISSFLVIKMNWRQSSKCSLPITAFGRNSPVNSLVHPRIIRALIFLDWKLSHESFNGLPPSSTFEERYLPARVHVKKEEVPIKAAGPSPSPFSKLSHRTDRPMYSSRFPPGPVKIEKNIVAPSLKSLPSPTVKPEIASDDESSHAEEKNVARSRVSSSNEKTPAVSASQEEKHEINNNHAENGKKPASKKSRGRGRSSHRKKKKRRTTSNIVKTDEQDQPPPPSKAAAKGRKRKQMTDNEEEAPPKQKNDEPSQDNQQILLDDEFLNDDNLRSGLRRSTRIRKAPTVEVPPVTSSPMKSSSQVSIDRHRDGPIESVVQASAKKKLPNGKCKVPSQAAAKVSSQSSKSNGRGKHRRRRRKGAKGSVNGVSSSSSDEHQPSEDEDEYNSDDYLPNQQQADELNDEELLEEDNDDDDDEFVPRRSAKTVAKRRGQISTDNIEDAPAGSSACYVCSKTDRPESLLLCDDCDDAYHLECLKPPLLSVPEGDWYCPLCEHKRLCDSLVDKFIQLLKDYAELEVKRSQCISKRTNRLANVMLNLDRMVKRSSKKRRTNGIVCSDDEERRRRRGGGQ